jgi:N-acetylglucosaminyldiphosphoundecaprenol N-acetyl-beta-D-mannosaminyltransferase
MNMLGVRIDEVNYQEALEVAENLVEKNGRHYIVTPNPEIISLAQKDLDFKEILNNADLSIADGIGLIWASWISGKRLRARVTGTDFLEGFAALAAEHGFNLFLLGSSDGVAAKAAQAFKARYPNLRIAGSYGGNSNPEFDKKTRSAIKDKKIDILAVAYGAPKQEKWIARNLPYLNVKLAIGVGGALDYISGEKTRAPGWAQRLGFEWAFRLLKEPARFKRQLALPYFSYLVFKERFNK